METETLDKTNVCETDIKVTYWFIILLSNIAKVRII